MRPGVYTAEGRYKIRQRRYLSMYRYYNMQLYTMPYLLGGHQSSLSAFLVRVYLHNNIYTQRTRIVYYYIQRYHIGFVGFTRARGNIVFLTNMILLLLLLLHHTRTVTVKGSTKYRAAPVLYTGTYIMRRYLQVNSCNRYTISSNKRVA